MKCGSLPAKADASKQRGFYDAVLHPLMERARSGEVALLFLDASHFVMGCDFLGYIYGKSRRIIRTWSGRKRYNVLGAIDFVTKQVFTVTNAEYITAVQVNAMLRKLSEAYAGKEIHIVLDNARYQKCKIVQDLAGELGIHLEYIPPYSPNLNLIERAWKFVKGELRTKYYDDFTVFCERIDSILAGTCSLYKGQMDRLVGENVQMFDNLSAITENTYATLPSAA